MRAGQPLSFFPPAKLKIPYLDKLIHDCTLNDRIAQEEIYRLFFPRAYAIARKYVRNEHDVLTIINDGFLKVFKYIHTFSIEKSPFEAWFVTVIKRTALDHVTQKKKPDIISLPDDSNLCVQDDEVTEEPQVLQHIISTLPSTTKSVISLSVEGYSHKEIAAILGISEGNSRWHLSDARKRIRIKIKTKKAFI